MGNTAVFPSHCLLDLRDIRVIEGSILLPVITGCVPALVGCVPALVRCVAALIVIAAAFLFLSASFRRNNLHSTQLRSLRHFRIGAVGHTDPVAAAVASDDILLDHRSQNAVYREIVRTELKFADPADVTVTIGCTLARRLCAAPALRGVICAANTIAAHTASADAPVAHIHVAVVERLLAAEIISRTGRNLLVAVHLPFRLHELEALRLFIILLAIAVHAGIKEMDHVDARHIEYFRFVVPFEFEADLYLGGGLYFGAFVSETDVIEPGKRQHDTVIVLVLKFLLCFVKIQLKLSLVLVPGDLTHRDFHGLGKHGLFGNRHIYLITISLCDQLGLFGDELFFGHGN